MNKFHRNLFIAVLLVTIISAGVIYSTVDINTIANLTAFQPWSVALALLAMGLGMFFDGSRLMHLVKISGEKITLYQAVQVIFGNYFLALLTPGATGGAVAQVMFLRHAGVPTGKAAVLVIVRTLASIFFLAFLLPFIFLHDNGILPGVENTAILAAMFSGIGLIALVIFLAKKGMLDKLFMKFTRRLTAKKRRVLFAFVRDTNAAIKLLSASPKSMVRVFFESGLNSLCIYAIVPCLFLGLGIYDADWLTVMGRMIFLNLLLYFTPTPGGAGIAEGGFVLLFGATVPAGTVGVVAVCWRLIAEYIPFVIGFYYTISVFGRNFVNRQLTSNMR